MRKLLILVSAVAFVAAFALPAAAADWSFYGSARMTTFMDSVSEEASATGYDDDDLTWNLQGNSRIGANVKTDGPVAGRFEYGHTAATGATLRLLYGTLKVGPGILTVGQGYTPLNWFYSNQVWGGDTDMLPYGGVYDGRRPMLQYAVKGFKIALVTPNASIPAAVTAGMPAGVSGDTDTTMPKIEATYGFNAGPAALVVGVGYQTYDVVAYDATDEEEEGIDSTWAGIGFDVDVAPAYVKGDVWIGTNSGQFGMWQQGADDWTVNASGDIEDCDSMGYLLVVGFKATPKINLELGYGFIQHDRDDYATEDDTSAYYIQMAYSLAKGVSITPEIGVIDYSDSAADTDQGDQTYFGAKWQINF